MLDVLRHYDETGYTLHAYVIMPDHLHLLLTPFESVEKSVQLFKGGFSFRAKSELEWKGEIWQPGFTDHRIRDEEDWNRHLEYIRKNPIEARLALDPILYEFMGFPSIALPQGLKPLVGDDPDVRAEARTLQMSQNVNTSAPTVPIQPVPPLVQGKVKGTGFSPSNKAVSSPRALAPAGGKR
jgi:hypothetical protein